MFMREKFDVLYTIYILIYYKIQANYIIKYNLKSRYKAIFDFRLFLEVICVLTLI
jgi:hypothetical protein